MAGRQGSHEHGEQSYSNSAVFTLSVDMFSSINIKQKEKKLRTGDDIRVLFQPDSTEREQADILFPLSNTSRYIHVHRLHALKGNIHFLIRAWSRGRRQYASTVRGS